MSRYLIAAHPAQQAILDAVAGRGIDDMSRRELGALAQVAGSPQKVKHHLSQMVKYGCLDVIGGQYRGGSQLNTNGAEAMEQGNSSTANDGAVGPSLGQTIPTVPWTFAQAVNDHRRAIKQLAALVKVTTNDTKNYKGETDGVEDRGEMIANLMLCYRHLEDASGRLGKALQAKDGGVSVYDRATTVGA